LEREITLDAVAKDLKEAAEILLRENDKNEQ
jgi:hypothetical protein